MPGMHNLSDYVRQLILTHWLWSRTMVGLCVGSHQSGDDDVIMNEIDVRTDGCSSLVSKVVLWAKIAFDFARFALMFQDHYNSFFFAVIILLNPSFVAHASIPS